MIIWLASYPKSGNTWLRAILSTLEFSQNGIFKPEYLNKIYAFPSFTHMKRVTEKIKDVHELKKNWIKAQDLINLDNKKKFVKTHHANCKIDNYNFTDQNNTLAVIYIVRDPRNVATSLSNYLNLSIQESINRMFSNLVYSGHKNDVTNIVGSWSQNYNSWKDHKNFYLVKYENLINDTFNELQKLLIFLKNKCQINKNIDVAKLINSTSFDSLKSFEDKKLLNLSHNKGVKFFNLGKENIWQNNLDKKYVDQIEEKFEKEMIELNYL